MNSIFDVEEIAYDKTKVNQIILFIKKASLVQRKSDIEDLQSKIIKLRLVYSKVNKDKKLEYKIKIKQNQSELKRLKSQFYYRDNKCQNLKLHLYSMMKKVIVKNILNYAKIIENSPVTDQCNNNTEMEAEAYIVMDKCIGNFKVSQTNDFYYYFNKSLARNFYRMFDREYRKKEKYDNYSAETKHVSKGSYDKGNNYDVEFLVNQMELTDLQKRVMMSKVMGEKKEDFLQNNSDVTSSKYYSTLKSIKIILTKMRENGDF